MRSLILIFFLSMTLGMTSSYQVQAQVTETTVQTELNADQILTDQPVQKVSFFKKIINSIKKDGLSILIGLIGGIFAKNGITKYIKKIAGITTIVTKELSDVSLSVHNFSELVDKSIKEDGSVDQNSIKEAFQAGKEVVVEFKEGIATLKPKKA